MEQHEFTSTGLLSESESAVRAGVSIATLKQFVQFGFLSAVERDGSMYFKEPDIRSVFATDFVGYDSEASGTQSGSNSRSTDHSTGHSATYSNGPAFNDNLTNGEAQTQTTKPVESIAGDVVHADETTLSVQTDDSVVSQYELIAMNRRLREEIRMLRDERDWLRTRLEKLEFRSERDQMLLLSESQTIKSLVTRPERRGFWQTLALPWFSAPPEQRS